MILGTLEVQVPDGSPARGVGVLVRCPEPKLSLCQFRRPSKVPGRSVEPCLTLQFRKAGGMQLDSSTTET